MNLLGFPFARKGVDRAQQVARHIPDQARQNLPAAEAPGAIDEGEFVPVTAGDDYLQGKVLESLVDGEDTAGLRRVPRLVNLDDQVGSDVLGAGGAAFGVDPRRAPVQVQNCVKAPGFTPVRPHHAAVFKQPGDTRKVTFIDQLGVPVDEVGDSGGGGWVHDTDPWLVRDGPSLAKLIPISYYRGMAVANNADGRPTAQRILDAAEDLFAAKGYSATSLGDVADRVGIRSPSLYNHFRNKEALYEAVIERLLDKFTDPLGAIQGQSVSVEGISAWLQSIVRLHHANPNLARLLQHAALSGGPQTDSLIERLFSPLFPDGSGEVPETFGALSPRLQPWAVMALNNMVMSYITMAPMYRDLLGEDPLGPEAIETQLELIQTLARLVMEPSDPTA